MDCSILSVIGNTPMVQLKKVFPENKFQLYLKLEAMNPGGSAKDRSAYSMVMHALETKQINQDSVIIESSSGNFGIAMAKICCYLHIRFICVVDVKTTEENIKLLKAYGAEIEYVDVPDEETGEYLQARLNRVRSLIEKIPNSFWLNQYNNEYNPLGHKNAMKEIAESLDFDVDYVFCATSTCGTIRGYSDYIREHNMKTKIIAVDAVGSVIFGGERKKRLIPGHGAAVVSGLFRENMADECIHITDYECVTGCHKLLQTEAVLAGGSTGAILSAIEKMKDRIPDNAKCVMIMHDNGDRYIDTIYSDKWIIEHFEAEMKENNIE